MGKQEARGSTGAHSTIIIPIEINFKYPQITARFLGRPSFLFIFCKTAMTHLEREFKETDASCTAPHPQAHHLPSTSSSSSSKEQLHPMNIQAVKHKAGEKAAHKQW